MKKKASKIFNSIILALTLSMAFTLSAWTSHPSMAIQTENPQAPDRIVKLIFLHHSTGENWLADEYGDLGLTLSQNNYFVSDTNYGWGPDAIGDRTDIPNWLEWFRGDQTERIMQAVYSESGQNSSYTRTLADPGGENEIILFKSCFPNSNLDGDPNDAPAPGTDYTVGNAKFVYNEILKYFATRPDKLFIVITAPPVSDPSLAENARAFNLWLVNDWLRENNYLENNVAVFDFYNVLTGPNNHHRFVDGQIEHVFDPGLNTSYYPSAADDDHPSVEGSRKATEEFIPLLNIFYHRWKAGLPSEPPVAATLPAEDLEIEPTSILSQVSVAGMIDDFESGMPAGSAGWEPFWDEATSTTISCAAAEQPLSGKGYALQIEFDIVADSWGTCALFYDRAQDWSARAGLSLTLHSIQENLPMDILIYAGTPENQESYLYPFMTFPDTLDHFAIVQIPWSEFRRVEWEDNAGAAFEKPDQVIGIAFGFDGLEQANNTSSVWIDDIGWMTEEPVKEATQGPSLEPVQEPVKETEPGAKRVLPCAGSLLLSLAFFSLIWALQRR